MRKLSLVILLVALAAFAFGKTYVVGTSADFPPFEYVENGEFKGFDMD